MSVDILRGLVMVIMALDHTREYWGITPVRPEDLSQASAELFLTRWVTHLCAPTFVFLSGLSVYLYQQKAGSIRAASRFVFTRGLWLLFVEVALISFIMVQGYSMTVLSVIWVIGCSMILLSALIWLPHRALVTIAVVMIAGHNLLPNVAVETAGDALLAMFHNTPFLVALPHPVLVTYTIVPWVAVMVLGYTAGRLYALDPEQRDARLLSWGIGFLAAFVVIRAINGYGDPFPWAVSERGWVYTVLSFVNVAKYPPSLLFLSLTLGICLVLLARYNAGSNGRLGRWLAVYGRVPFFFFVIHFAVISVSSLVWTRIQYGAAINVAFSNAADLPEAYAPNLVRVYAVWALVVVLMYFPCKWFGAYRKRNQAWWLKYL